MSELRQKWIEALRSGEYKQGQGALRRGGPSYCCLGVAVEAAGLPFNYSGLRMDGVAWNGATFGLSDDLIEQLGLSPDVMSRLVSMNDDERRSFSEIADYLDKLDGEATVG